MTRNDVRLRENARRFELMLFLFSVFGLCTFKFAVRRAPGVGQVRLGQDGNGMIPLGGLRETR